MASVRESIADRLGFYPLKEQALERRVARGKWYYGDGATLLLLLIVLVVTGAAMTLTYAPTPDSAYQSVVHITERQRLGRLVRGLHYWAAGFMVLMLVMHLLRQILVGGYKFPREGTWVIGVFLFFLVITMSFTGYVLRWDERSIHALRVSLHMFHNVPLIGDWLVTVIQGGSRIGTSTLTRIYAVHVIFFPLLLSLLAGWHVYLVLLHGVTSIGERQQPVHTAEQQRKLYEKQAQSEERGEKFHPETTARSGAMAFTVFVIVLLFAIFAGPRKLMGEGNLTDESFPVEEWWFWWYSGLIALLPGWLAPSFVVLFPIVLFLALIALPFVDRGPYRGIRKRPIAIAVVILTTFAILYLSDLRRRSPWTAWPDPNPPPVPANIALSEQAELGRHLYAQWGCTTCHAIAGHGWHVGPDLAGMPERRTRAWMRRYILAPPDDVAMPAYEGRIPEDELERLLDFLMAAQAFPRR